jgi:hypothetical protein
MLAQPCAEQMRKSGVFQSFFVFNCWKALPFPTTDRGKEPERSRDGSVLALQPVFATNDAPMENWRRRHRSPLGTLAGGNASNRLFAAWVKSAEEAWLKLSGEGRRAVRQDSVPGRGRSSSTVL